MKIFIYLTNSLYRFLLCFWQDKEDVPDILVKHGDDPEDALDGGHTDDEQEPVVEEEVELLVPDICGQDTHTCKYLNKRNLQCLNNKQIN